MTSSRPLGPVILRVAGWPIETLDPLRSPEFAARVDAWIESDTAIAAMNADLAARIHAAVPTIADSRNRRSALALKRHLHSGTLPAPEALVAPLRAILGSPLEDASRRWHAHAGERAAIEAAHSAERDRAEQALRLATGTERFQRALCLASPTAFRQCRRARDANSSERSRRRLQATLHHYLMRAVGRATPNGLWSGTALEDVAGGLNAQAGSISVVPSTAQTRVSPDLALFAPALDAVSRLRLDDISMRFNPTLSDTGEGGWTFGTFIEGFWADHRIDDHVPLRASLDRFGFGERFTLRQFTDALAACDAALSAGSAREFAAFWLRHGLLWSSVAFPAHYGDPWQGLEAIVASLPACDRANWQACRACLRQHAAAIETNADVWTAERLRTVLDEARATVAGLLGLYGVTLPERRDVLVVDRTAPFRFAVSDRLIEDAATGLRACWDFDRYGLGEIETLIGIRETFGDLSTGAPVRLASLLPITEARLQVLEPANWEERVLSGASGEEIAAARAAFARWEAAIGPSSAARSCRLAQASHPGQDPLPPGSALLIVGLGTDGPVLRIGGLTPEPSFFQARFASLFRRDAGAPDAFLAWLSAGWRHVEERWPALHGCDLAIRNQRNANVASRPRLARCLLDPLDDGGRLLRQATIARGANGRPTLTLADDGEAGLLVPFARSAAALGGLDRCAALLSAVSTHLGRPSLIAPMPRLSREASEWHHLPRLMLDETAIGPERWTPADELGTSLANAKGAELFICWRRFVRSAGLPNLVYSFHGRHRTETLLAADGILGVECLAHDLAIHGPALRFQELFPPPDQSAVRDADGRRYIAELAVAWHADPAFWDRYVAAAPEACTEPRMSAAEAGRRPERARVAALP